MTNRAHTRRIVPRRGRLWKRQNLTTLGAPSFWKGGECVAEVPASSLLIKADVERHSKIFIRVIMQKRLEAPRAAQ